MTATDPHYINAKNLALDILRKESAITTEKIRDTATRSIEAMKVFGPEVAIDLDELVADLRHLLSIRVRDATVLDDHDPNQHVPWLEDRRAAIAWKFWPRYMTYLERDFGMPPQVVNNLHQISEMILARIEDPIREGEWDRRGMVVGSVQSGKTANYIGLINKALDAGYKLIIVLAGIHSNLRAQTQLRIDEGVLGFDTKKGRRLDSDSQQIGVGRIAGNKLVVHSLTSSDDKGDFKKAAADTVGVMIGGDPVVLVTKKNSRVLANLLQWVKNVEGIGEGKNKVIPNVPLLLIDDEADNASINVKEKKKKANQIEDDEEGDTVSAINRKIREILSTFSQSAYVGYTATPFANIFINPAAQTEALGDDIFPRSFIINVKPPDNYMGPAKVFGVPEDEDAGIEGEEGLPIIQNLDSDLFSSDYASQECFPPKHKNGHVPTALPGSLKVAVRHFILTCAARRARGQISVHNSMLVHVTRFVSTQGHVCKLLFDEIVGLQRRLEHGDGARRPTLRQELEKLWNEKFVPVSRQIGDQAGASVTWKEVDAQLHAAAAKMTVLEVNSTAGLALDYKEYEKEGRTVIAVGGDKLSRGLTLEGLSVSYFLRTSRMYDTLMQMGRWFGYRPGYLDLCRVFTTGTLVNWYRHIAQADAELRREFDYMVNARLTPIDYGLRVRTHPGGMIVTALNKMCHSETLELSWAGVLVQTSDLPRDRRLENNFNTTEKFLKALGEPTRVISTTHVWHGKDAKLISKFVAELQFPAASARASGMQLASFIDQQAKKPGPELTSWTVALISTRTSDESSEVAGLKVGFVTRAPEGEVSENAPSYSLVKANILNPADEGLDFKAEKFSREWFEAIRDKLELREDVSWLEEQIDRDALDVAEELTGLWLNAKPPRIRGKPDGQKRASGRVLRALRRKSHGLLLVYPLERLPAAQLTPDGPPVIGVALSFPSSDTVRGVEYRVNSVWGEEMLEDSEYED